MKIISLLLLALLASCVPVPAAPNNNFPPVFPPEKTVWLSAETGNSIANGNKLKTLLRRVPIGKQAVVTPGDYYIQTNVNSLLPRGVDMFCFPGVRITVGTTGDAADCAIFDDSFDGLGARTNRVFGHGEFIITNSAGRVCYQSDPATTFYMEGMTFWTLGNVGAFEQVGGRLKVVSPGFVRSDGYDAFSMGAPVSTYIDVAEVYAGDTIWEGVNYANWGDCVVNIGYGEALASGGGFGIAAMTIGDKNKITVGVLNFKRSSAAVSGVLTNTNPSGDGILFGCQIKSLAGGSIPTISPAASSYGTAFKLQNCTITGPAGFDPILVQTTAGLMTIEDSTIIAGLNATNWVRASNGPNMNLRLYGRVTVNRTNHASVTVLGNTYVTNAMNVVTN